MKKQAVNPYLSSYEYIPDGEPHVFGNRVYVYGSHDRFNGPYFCMNDYMCWSAPIDNLKDWRYEGVIYKKTQDPTNRKGWHSLYAPDVAKGIDGIYYIYYAFEFLGVMAVAVSNTPAGKYEFYGHIHFQDGKISIWGGTSGDAFAFDPGVLVDDDGRVYLYSGFAPKATLPAIATGFENHEFFEGSSIRKIKSKYYFIYSCVHNHELCYATSNSPVGGFKYGGTIISNGDLFLEGNSNEKHSYNYIGNNHGSIVEANGQWYVFYHRQTNRHPYYTQKRKDRENNPDQYIANLRSGSITGFKCFDIKDTMKISIEICGKA